MAILHRAPVEGVVCDFTCIGRFYDFFEKRDGRWGLVLRQPIYEKDRIDPVEPGDGPKLDPDAAARFPEGYRHLAYLQTKHGYTVKPDMPGARRARARGALRARRGVARGRDAVGLYFPLTRRMNFSNAASCCLTMSMVG